MHSTSSILPALKLGAIVDFVVSNPGEQTRLVEKLRKAYLDEDARPWLYYEPWATGLKQAITSLNPAEVLQRVVDSIDDPIKLAHFRELHNGSLQFLSKYRPSLVPVRSSTWSDGVNTIAIKPQLGLNLDAGPTPLAVFTYMKKAPLSQGTANVPLWMIEQACSDILPSGHAGILDVRRGKLWTLRPNAAPKRLNASAAGVVANFMTIWRKIAS